jgi:hypothetical protein
MPQIAKSKDELRRMILDEVRNYVVCAERTDVRVRADPDRRWTADIIPSAEGLHDNCVYYIDHVVRRLRIDFDLMPSD